METSDLFYPQIAARVGSYEFTKGIRIEIHSSQDTRSDWAKLRFTEQFQQKISLSTMDAASVELGYNGVYDETFKGYVAKPYNTGSNADEITLKDEMLRLEQTEINNTFLDTTPQEMISYFLAKAGITSMALTSQAYPERKYVPIRKMSAAEAIDAVHSAWGITQKYFFSGGTFYWGTKPSQEKVYSFEYGVNILNLARVAGVWELETISAPFVKHSHQIAVTHPKVSGTFEVSKMDFITNDDGFIRTYIHFN